MKLTVKIALIFFLFWLFLVSGFYFTYNRVVKPKIYEFEMQLANEKLERFIRALNYEISNFHKFCSDYAWWDDTYEFVRNKDEEYINSNFTNESFSENHFNLVIIINNEGRTLYGVWFDEERKEKKNLPRELSSPIWALTHPLLKITNLKEGKTGLWRTTYGTLIVSSHRILTSKGEGEPRGTLIFGKLITPDFWKTIAEHVVLNISVFEYLDKDKFIKKSIGVGDFPAFVFESPSELSIYHLIYDIFNKPLLIARIVHPLSVLKAGSLMETRATLYFLIIIGIGLVFVWFTVQKNIVYPIQDLTRHIQHSAYEAVISTYPTPVRNDEIALLIFHFNRMGHKINKLMEETQEWNKLLEERERYFRTLLNVVPCGIVELNETGEIETANDIFKEMFSFKIGGLTLRGIPISKIINSRAIEKYLYEGREEYFESEERVDNNTEEGMHIHYKFKRTARNGSKHFIGVIWDITEFKKIQEKLETQKRLALLGEASASLAHELRNMVSAVQSGFTLLLEETNPEKRDLIVSELKNSIFRLEDTLRKLLDFTRTYKLEKKKISIGLLIKEQFNNCKIALGTLDNYEIEVEGESEIYCDASMLSRVFFNLLKNSIEAMPKGGKIKVFILEEGDIVKIIIEDSGIGIEPENMDKVGKPFFTTKSKGTGLGLAIAIKIIESHNGKIDISSEVNKGTKVVITLPKMEV